MSVLKYPKGSEWRKWDLHVHTPFTKLNNQYGNSQDENIIKRFCEKLHNTDISVFGITDYFNISSFKEFLNKYKSIFPDDKKVFLPNIEFRIDSKNSRNEHIQIHVLFSPDLVETGKIEEFLTRLELVSTDDYNLTCKYCTENDLNSVSYEKAMVKFDKLIEQLECDFERAKYLIIGVSNGYGSLRPGPNDGRGGEYAKELDKKCDAFFGNKENVDFYLNKIDGRSQFGLPPKAVLLGSDCHSFDHIDNNLGKKFTWIKANPTFEGLRQILFEPELRVRIQEEHPYNDFPKPYFSCIKINETKIFNNSEVMFSKNEIPLNPDLVTIIGGRGTGKSLLLDSIAKTFNKSNRDRVKDIIVDADNFSISYNKDESNSEPLIFKINETNNLDYLHISQGDVKEIVDPKKPEKIDNEIKKLLGEIEYVKKINTEEIEKIIDELFEINDFLNKKNEDNKLINSIEYVDNEINNKKQLIENITTKENRELIQKYTDNLREISRKDLFIEKLKKLKESLKNFEKETNKEIDVINKNLDKDKEIPSLSFDLQIEKVENILDESQQIRESLQKENENIQKKIYRKRHKR